MKPSHISLPFAALLCMALGLANGQQPAEAEASRSLSVAIASSGSAYHSGDRITIEVRVKNVGDKLFQLRYEDPLSLFFRFVVVRTIGVNSWVVPLTAEGKLKTSPLLGNLSAMRSVFLQPGQELRGELPLSEYYDMKGSGTYKIVCYIQPEPFLSKTQRPRLNSKELILMVSE
jgi:hypothetical protein